MEFDPSYIDSTLSFGFILSYFTLGLGVPVFVTPALIRNLPLNYRRAMQADEFRWQSDVRELAEKCNDSRKSAVDISFPQRGFVIARARLARIANSPPLMEWSVCWKNKDSLESILLFERRGCWPVAGSNADLVKVAQTVDLLLFFNRTIDLFKFWTIRAPIGRPEVPGFRLSSPVAELDIRFSGTSMTLLTPHEGYFQVGLGICAHMDDEGRVSDISRKDLLERLAKFESTHQSRWAPSAERTRNTRDGSPKRRGSNLPPDTR